MSDLYIGLMSGTSIDGIDAALVDFSQTNPTILGTQYTPYSTSLREKILALCHKGEDEIRRLGELDVELGKKFAVTVNCLLQNTSTSFESINAIGSHGQTIRHIPYGAHPFTLQIADPNTIAAHTKIPTVADFRRKDLAYNGQGAPLVPAFHNYLFSNTEIPRAIVNIGGIANITILTQKKNNPVIGFDVGPGNALIDAWIYKHLNKNYDEKGSWGAQGNVQIKLLSHLLDDIFFKLLPPKSTGREYFNIDWLNRYLQSIDDTFTAIDIQATLAELTAQSIIKSISQYISSGEILICGGGARNDYLMSRLQKIASQQFTVSSTQKYNLDPDWIEAVAFAWLARQTLNRLSGNLPSVTGAKQAAILGGIYYP